MVGVVVAFKGGHVVQLEVCCVQSQKISRTNCRLSFMHVFSRFNFMNEYTQFNFRLIYLSNARYTQDILQ
jgi:hypothetical protein